MAKLKRPRCLSKRDLWLYHFTNEDDKETFLNKTASARAAHYKCTTDASFHAIGQSNFKALRPKINTWLDENGLSEEALKLKLLSLLSAKKTKFFSHKGVVINEREVDALEIQRKSLDMALRARGSYAADKHEISGPGGGPIATTHAEITPDMSEKEAADLYIKMVKGK